MRKIDLLKRADISQIAGIQEAEYTCGKSKNTGYYEVYRTFKWKNFQKWSVPGESSVTEYLNNPMFLFVTFMKKYLEHSC